MMHFVFIGFVWFLLLTVIISLNSINQLIFVMVKCGVLFEVRTEFLHNIYTSFVFKWLKRTLVAHVAWGKACDTYSSDTSKVHLLAHGNMTNFTCFHVSMEQILTILFHLRFKVLAVASRTMFSGMLRRVVW
jgi:hypothetical protein